MILNKESIVLKNSSQNKFRHIARNVNFMHISVKMVQVRHI